MYQLQDTYDRLRNRYGTKLKQFGDVNCLGYAMAIIPRVLFAAHAALSILLLRKYIRDIKEFKDLPVWSLYTPLGVLCLESMYTIIIRKGHEYKHIWYSGFLYLTIQVPVIWILELAFLQNRITYKNNYQLLYPNKSTNGLTQKSNYNPDKEIDCFYTAFNCSDQFIKNFSELGLITVIIIGRWMLPRGELTRDQLSALLIGYVNTAADITEFVGLHSKYDKTKYASLATNLVLAIYSCSLLQFVFVTTSTTYEYTESEKQALKNLTSNMSQKQAQQFLQPTGRKMRKKSLSRKVDSLALDAFRGGQRAGRRKQVVMADLDGGRPSTGVLKASKRGVKPISRKARRGIAAQMIAEEEPLSPNNHNDENGNEMKDMSDMDQKECNNNDNKTKRSKAFKRWNADPIVSSKMARVKRSLIEENWHELSATLLEMKRRLNKEKFKQEEADFDEKMKAYPAGMIQSVEPPREDDETSTWTKWLELIQTEMGGILVALILQEAPFFFVRVAFMYQYQLDDRSVVFYTTKNCFMLLFLSYRLWVAMIEE